MRYTHRIPVSAATMFAGLVVAGCGSAATTTPSGGAATPASASTPAPTATTTAAAAQCPSGTTVGAALGITLPSPTSVVGGGTQSLPASATGIACDYHAPTYNVLVQVISNIDPSAISMFSSHFPVPYQSVSGVGDQARSFVQSLGAGRDNEAVVATKGMTLVAVTATATPATLSQVESLVSQLL